jgi:hypothetical protein
MQHVSLGFPEAKIDDENPVGVSPAENARNSIATRVNSCSLKPDRHARGASRGLIHEIQPPGKSRS